MVSDHVIVKLKSMPRGAFLHSPSLVELLLSAFDHPKAEAQGFSATRAPNITYVRDAPVLVARLLGSSSAVFYRGLDLGWTIRTQPWWTPLSQ